jgi:hypothetical protein
LGLDFSPRFYTYIDTYLLTYPPYGTLSTTVPRTDAGAGAGALATLVPVRPGSDKLSLSEPIMPMLSGVKDLTQSLLYTSCNIIYI